MTMLILSCRRLVNARAHLRRADDAEYATTVLTLRQVQRDN
jgi:hypothetical protein